MPNNRQQKHGTLQAFNVSPKGAYEGLLLDTDGGLIQANFPPEFSTEISALASEGDQLRLEVEPGDRNGHAAHPIYKLISAANAKEKTFSIEARNRDDGHFSGQIKRLNYALHGEVNGGILNTGDFLHVKPHGAAALEIKVGMRVKGTGTAKPMLGGRRVIEAEEVNGIHMEKAPKPKKKAH